MLPKAVLFDLDDTILDDTGCVRACWEDACNACAPDCNVEPAVLLAAIETASAWFWSDPDRHRTGRLDLLVARTEVARLALAGIGIDDSQAAAKMGAIYHRGRDAGIQVFPDAVETVRWFRRNACKLALLTNGDGPAQRSKLDRFELGGLFDTVLIEGELGYGKPDERVYRLALQKLEVDARDTWMVGDHLEWDVAQPQRLGIFGIWINRGERKRQKPNVVQPDLVIRKLSELRSASKTGT